MKKLLVTFLLILSMLLIACTRELGSDVVPNAPGDTAGDTSGAADQTNLGETAATEGGEAAATEGGEAAPVEGGEAAATEGGEAAPVDGGEDAAAEGGEAAPAAGGEAAAAEGGEAAPAAGGEAAAAEGGEAAPAAGGEAAAAEGGEAAPAAGGEAAPADGGEAAPADGGAAAVPATTNAAGEQVYVVQYGDTVGEIAKELGITVEDIQAANGLYNVNTIEAGQELKIVAGAAASVSTDDGKVVIPVSQFDPERYVTHIVSYGETLFSIGQWYGFTVEELATFNGITNPTRIDTAQVLRIPIR